MWPRHAAKGMGKACIQGQAKAKAAPYGHAGQGRGMQQPRPRQPPWAGSEGQGMLACMLPRPRQAAKAKACCQGQGRQRRPRHACVGMLACPWVQAGGHAGMPLGAGSSKAPACPVGEGVACPVGGMPRPWHALGTPTRPWQHLGGLLLPSLDSLFGHLLLFPP
jgi:hypothetical protein